MPTTSIKISQLDPISSLTGSDFFPIDQSSSLKTYRSSLTQLQNFFSTGSFTGSFSGSFKGLGTSPQFIGTSSWAISSSRSISSSYSNFSISSSYSNFALSASRAETASYALNLSSGDLSGAGTVNYLAIWSGSNKTLGNSVIYYGTPISGYPGYVSNANVYVQKDTPFVYVTGSGQASVVVRGDYNSSLSLANAVTTSNAWVMVVSGDQEDLVSPGVKGALDWSTYTSNSLFSSRQPTVDSGTPAIREISRMMRIKSSGVYFWPLSSVQSLSKDSTFNIGVDSGTQNTTTRFLIDVYSGSNASNPVINHVQKAIEVRYGSSSLATTFCVSSSGKTYIGDKLQVNGGVQLKTDTNYSAINSLGDNVSVNAENYTTKFINLGNHGTASITMSRGSQLNVIVNQSYNHGGAWDGAIYFTGSYINGNGQTFSCPIVWRNGSQPTVTVGSANKADFFTFVAVNTHNNGPKGSGAPDDTVIYGTVVQNMY